MILQLKILFNKNAENLSQVGRKVVKSNRWDGGGEFIRLGLCDWGKKRGVVNELTIEYSSKSSGRSELLNRTVMDSARTMMLDLGNAAELLWTEAFNTASYIRN